MSSTRIDTHEMMQSVNNRGWYQGEGTLFVHTPDPTRYNEDFWPTVDPYRLPGITVDPRPRKEGDSSAGQQGKPSKSPWAGGVQLGAYAMASMGLAAQEFSLTAQKSWLFAGDQIVCLGSAIKSDDDRTIETIVENAKLDAAGDNAFSVNGAAQPVKLGWSADLPSTRWAFMKGSFPDADMGWVFPTPANLKAVREARTGKWQSLFSRDANQGEKTKNYLTFWFDHGKSPKNATYAYVILPAAKQDAVEAYADKLPIRVAANSETVHAVEVPALGLRGATFWSAADAAGISSSGKASVLVLEKGGATSVAVADPTQLEKSVELTIETTASAVVKADERIKVIGNHPLKLSVNLDGAFGRSLVIELK
jgi:hyaluronate lyase